jgi:hypothetical protein
MDSGFSLRYGRNDEFGSHSDFFRSVLSHDHWHETKTALNAVFTYPLATDDRLRRSPHLQ